MIVGYTVVRCPSCRRFADAHFFWISTGLGPSTFRCPKCGHEYASGREEWERMRAIRRTWYWIATLIYTGLLGLLLCIVVVLWTGALGGTETLKPSLSIGAIILGALVTLSFQVWRILASKSRTASPPRNGFEPTFLSGTVNLQF